MAWLPIFSPLPPPLTTTSRFPDPDLTSLLPFFRSFLYFFDLSGISDRQAEAVPFPLSSLLGKNTFLEEK